MNPLHWHVSFIGSLIAVAFLIWADREGIRDERTRCAEVAFQTIIKAKPNECAFAMSVGLKIGGRRWFKHHTGVRHGS